MARRKTKRFWIDLGSEQVSNMACVMGVALFLRIAYFFGFSQYGSFRTQGCQQAGSDLDVIVLGCVYGYGSHPSTSSLHRLPSSRRAISVLSSSAAMASR